MKRKLAAAMAAVMMLGTGAAFAADIAAEPVAYSSDKLAADAPITREQFCELAFNMLNDVKELPVAKLAKAPFDDVSNPKINALAFVGIVSGRADGVFAPEAELTREEAAVIMYRMAEYAGLELPMAKVDAAYADNAAISPWALSQVYSLKLVGVIADSDGENFRPADSCTVGEASASLLKLGELLAK